MIVYELEQPEFAAMIKKSPYGACYSDEALEALYSILDEAVRSVEGIHARRAFG